MNAWHVSSVLAYHLPRSPVAPGRGFEPRVTALETVSLTIGNPGMKMEESGGIEPRWLSTSPRFSGALGDHSPALSLEHPAAVETANTVGCNHVAPPLCVRVHTLVPGPRFELGIS